MDDDEWLSISSGRRCAALSVRHALLNQQSGLPTLQLPSLRIAPDGVSEARSQCGHRESTLQGDWTDPAAYAHMRGYEAAEFAAEYVIRNDEFVAECSQLTSQNSGSGELVGPPDYAARWGARFLSHR